MQYITGEVFIFVVGAIVFLFVSAVVLMIAAFIMRWIFRINTIVAEQRRTNALLESLINQPAPASPPTSGRVP